MKLQITSLAEIGQLRFLNAGRGPGRQTLECLPVQHGVLRGMPDALDALLRPTCKVASPSRTPSGGSSTADRIGMSRLRWSRCRF